MNKEKVMKKLINIIAITSLIMVSCKQDFIDLNPISSINVDVLYQTDKDFADALIGIYDNLQNQYNRMWMFGDIRADDSWQQIYKSNDWSYADLFQTTSADALINSTWRYYYVGIYRANMVLTKIEEVDDAAALKNKAQYIAEAKFLRALMYFDLVRIFGAVPMVTAPLQIAEGYITPREPVANIYNQLIIPDLIAAEGGLPASYSSIDVGRPTKGAAKALLGKVYLYSKDFGKAETKLKEVTAMGYALLPNYEDLFDYTNEHHSEYIFDIEYEEGMGEGSGFTEEFLPNFKKLTDFYGIGFNGNESNNPTQTLIDIFSDDDERKIITVGYKGGFYGADNVWVPLPSNTNQTYTMKYITSTTADNDSKANWKVIRYGDVLLMLAEALNENGKTSEALPYLNLVHERAGLTPLSSMTQAQMRDAIVLERRLELSFEGKRWFDLVRTGQAYNVMKDQGMKEYMTVFPLPLQQVELVNDASVFPQNPGYE